MLKDWVLLNHPEVAVAWALLSLKRGGEGTDTYEGHIFLDFLWTFLATILFCFGFLHFSSGNEFSKRPSRATEGMASLC